MINRCKFLNPLLTLCSQINRACPCMADPCSCPMYDEELTCPYHTWSASHPITEPKTLEEFTNRIEAELDGMGIKVVREMVEMPPDWF